MTRRRARAIAAGELLRDSAVVRLFCALASGILVALCFPKFSFGALAFVALAPLTAAIVCARTTREAFLLGTVASTVTWLINVPWVIGVMSHYGGLPKSVGIAIYIAMSIALGLFTGLFFGFVLHRLRLTGALWIWVLAVPAAWLAVEYGRTHLLSGFPWDPLGMAIVNFPSFVQLARVTGTYGLGFLIVVPSAVLAWAAVNDATRKQRLVAIGGVVVFLALWWGAGALMLRSEDSRMRTERMHGAAIIQPDITQEMRWSEKTLYEIFDRMSSLTEEGLKLRPDVVVWPESTVPLTYAATDFYREFVENTSRTSGTDIILGSVAEDPADPAKLWNAAYLVSHGVTVGRYDKIRLVPFGEYVPLRKLLFFAEKLVRAVGEFQFGANDKPLAGRHRYGPAICYEVVYPQITAAQVRNGANVLVTITNDAWFGNTAAPYQHLDNARLRAVETNRWMLRSATTGISAVIDPAGRITQSLGIGERGVIAARFGVRETRTAYVRFGDWFAMVTCIVLAVALVWRIRAEGRAARGR